MAFGHFVTEKVNGGGVGWGGGGLLKKGCLLVSQLRLNVPSTTRSYGNGTYGTWV